MKGKSLNPLAKNLIVLAVRYFLRWLFSNERNKKKPHYADARVRAEKTVDQAFDEMGFGDLNEKKHPESE